MEKYDRKEAGQGGQTVRQDGVAGTWMKQAGGKTDLQDN